MSGGNSSHGGRDSSEGGDEVWDFSKVAGAAAATAAVASGLYALLKSSGSGDPEPEVAFEARRVREEQPEYPWSPHRGIPTEVGWTKPGTGWAKQNVDLYSLVHDGSSASGAGYSFMSASAVVGWSFPPHGWIKCNVDGSAPPDRGIAGCGGVFRDATGCWVYGFARRLETCTSSAAELEAISTALDIALVRGYRKLILETDSLTASDVVNSKNGASARRPHEKKLVQSIRNKLENRRWEIKIVHCNGEGNQVADWLANLSHGLQVGDQIELPTLPDGCRSCQELMLEDAKLAKTKPWRAIR